MLNEILTAKNWGETLEICRQKLAEYPEAIIGDVPGSLRHSFAEGCYVREWSGKKGTLLITKIHKKEHPFFMLKGEVAILTKDGAERIKAPYHGITPAGTQRAMYVVEDTIWVTVHITKSRDLALIEKEGIAETMSECVGQR